MKAINKNKEEIENINTRCKCNCYVYNRILCEGCKVKLKATIKTSILWCEDEIEFLSPIKESLDDIFRDNDFCGKEWTLIKIKIEQLQTHLNWLKEQEKKL